MLKVITLVAIAALAVAFTTTPQPAFARDDGAVAAGVITGLAVGAVVGSQIDGDRDYRDNDRDRDYRRHYSECRIEQQEVTDRHGREHMERVRVCD
jgi:hypothetical protein